MMRVPPSAVKIVALAVWLAMSLSGQAQAQLASLSGDLLALLFTGSTQDVRAIVRGDVETIKIAAADAGLPVLRVLDGLAVVQGNPAELSRLRQLSGINGISLDNIVAPFTTVDSKAIAADQARAAQSGLLGIGSYPAVSGKGVGVAVIDSGITTSHAALTGKVVASVSFATGDTSTADGFGHGTHVAGIIAGLPGAAQGVTTEYGGGIAPGAHLINVKVLNASGAGYTSDVIAGIQWTIANRSKYAIKVVNLSLGHPQVEPCITDPLCLAAEQASAAGLVVVASAGNSGKDANGREVYASISTPGVSPSAITVGALVTWGTVTPDDDTIATYSSRGPTKFEAGLKPDVVAPGNKIVSLAAKGSYLLRAYPNLYVAGVNNNAYMRMSGTSMAAPMVSGGAALLLEGGALTAKQVKLALQLSGTFMASDGIMRAGLGRVNLYSARRVNNAVNSLTGTFPSVTIAGRVVKPSGLLTNQQLDTALTPAGTSVLSALDLLSAWLGNPLSLARLSGLGGLQMIWGDQIPAQQMIWGDQMPSGLQMIWGDQTPFGQQMIWGDQSLAQQMIWGDQTFGQQMIWGDQAFGQQMIWGDQTFGQQMIWGDQTSGQQMIWGDADSSNANQMIWGDTVKGQ
jgi:serine protease AprX